MDPLNANFTEIGAVTSSTGKPSGLATLDSSGKLVQMPTAADVGAAKNFETVEWVPELSGSTTPGSPTYDYHQGKAIRIGDLVLAWCSIAITNKGGMVGKLYITGLPYVPLETTQCGALGNVQGFSRSGFTPMTPMVNKANNISLITRTQTTTEDMQAAHISDSFAIWGISMMYPAEPEEG